MNNLITEVLTMAFKDAVSIYTRNKNTNVQLKVVPGHFVTNHSHINYYVDMTEPRMMYREAKAIAEVLSRKYKNIVPVDTIFCLDGTEVIGTMLAEYLVDSHLGRGSHAKKEVAVVTPELGNNGRLLLRDNLKPLVKNRDCIILVASASTGYTVHKGVETVRFYGGIPRGVSAVFSKISSQDGVPVDSIFTLADLPDYRSYDFTNCPFCAKGQPVDAMVNGHGYSAL
jgi:orotate phosphoribosyltransferase